MAEARAEEEDERLREPGGARRSAAEHSDRNKPDQRLSSSGALSSIRAAIKRTSTRTSSQSDHHRDRRRPEITILSAEPLTSSPWFPGAFPPAPPPAPPSWSVASGSVQLPPPSYEQVIKEKTREQNLPSTSSSSSSSSPPSARRYTTTIATQTDTDSPDPQSSAARPVRRPLKPPRPSLPLKYTTSPHTDPFIDSDGSETRLQTRDAPRKPEQRDAQTDSDDVTGDVTLIDSAPTVRAFSQSTLDFIPEQMREEPSVRPRPRPRSRASFQPIISEEVLDQPMTREVKVQTLVRLKDDGAESVFAGFSDCYSNFSSKYMQDLLEVFGSEDANVHDDRKQNEEEEETSVNSAVPSEPLNRPQPRPRTQKPKPLLPPKPSTLESEVFETEEPTVKPNASKQTCIAPAPAPRPLLNKHHSTAHEHHMKDFTSSSEHKNPPTPPEKRPVTPNDNDIMNHPSVPRHSRPPPPLLGNTSSTSQVSVSVTGASGPSLPPRPSGGRLLPLRPPSIKLTKPPSPASSNQVPASRVPKRGPPLPPRPKPGHPLYKIYSRKMEGSVKVENVGEPQEEPFSLEEEEQLIVLDDTSTDPLSHVSLTPEVKGEDVLVCDDVWRESCAHVQTHNRCVAVYTFTGEEGELTFSEGDVISLMEYVNEEWGRGCLNGQIGIFPLNFIKVESETFPREPASQSPAGGERKRGRSLYDFSPQCEDELCLKAGDVVCDLEDVDDEWFLGELDGKRGIVPKNYIQVLPET